MPEIAIALETLITLPEEDLAKVDIAAMNLACAVDLPGSENMDRPALLAKLDSMARYVAHEIARHRYRFQLHPEEYNHSWGEFCMLFLTNILQMHFDVRYNPDQITPVNDATGFDFTRSQDLFINGLLQGTGGTCTSMPVLYVAVGRRLGFPLKLVTSPGHTFLRWDDPVTGERFNIEGTSRGYGSHPDEYYENLVRPLHPIEKERGNYFESLTPREELSVFLNTRGDNLFASGRLLDAHLSYQNAVKLDPRNYGAKLALRQTKEILAALRKENDIDVAFQRQQQRLRNDPRVMIPGTPSIPSATTGNARPPGPDFPIGSPVPQGINHGAKP